MSIKRLHNVGFYNIAPRAVHCLAYQKTHKKLALSRSDSSVEIWNLLHCPHIERTIPPVENISIESLKWCVSRLFSAGLQGTIVEYDLQTLSMKYQANVTGGPCWCIDINRTETRLAAGTENGYINIFTITDTGLQFEKHLHRQEGRILSIAWDPAGEVIATGSLNVVSIYNVETGHKVYDMQMYKISPLKAIIVWCVAVTKDLTVVSGDSSGRTSFWDGNTGTLIKQFRDHQHDVLCLCLTENEKSVFSAGVDTTVTCYSEVQMQGGLVSEGSTRTEWIKLSKGHYHNHDVRAIVAMDDKIISGGCDGYLKISNPRRMVVMFPPVLQDPCAAICRDARYIMLRYPTYLEVWQLGSTLPIEGAEFHSSEILPLNKKPCQLLTLKSRDNDAIVCADMSSNGEWLAYSTHSKLTFFKFQAHGGQPSIQKVPVSCEVKAAHRIKFSSDSSRVVIATFSGDICIFQLKDGAISLEHKFNAQEEKLLQDLVTFLTLSKDGRYIVAADPQSNIVVWTTEDFKHYCTLPRRNFAPTALGVQPSNNNLVVAYCDRKVVEYSLPQRQYTEFTKDLERKHPKAWCTRKRPFTHITFDPSNENIILLQESCAITVFNKSKLLPMPEKKIPRLVFGELPVVVIKSGLEQPVTNNPKRAIHEIAKKDYLVYTEWLSSDELVTVEVLREMLLEMLPPVMQRKKYGVN